MIRALGYSENRFDPKDPGRLCRGRERWIEPWDVEGDPGPMYRIVVSGATFTDDGASDARRGLLFSGVDLAEVIEALYPSEGRGPQAAPSGAAPKVAFMEDGHPADIPPEAQGVEAYEGYRAGGRQELGLVRWYLPISSVEELRAVLVGGAPEERIRGLLVLREAGDLDDETLQRAFDLVGFSTLDSPPARYQPAALPELVTACRAVIVLHRDKHGPALAVYTDEPIADLETRLSRVPGAGDDLLLVPFAIPPMLARWDRALAELRARWPASRPFPVPQAPPGAHPRFDRHERRRNPGGSQSGTTGSGSLPGLYRDDDEVAAALEELPPIRGLGVEE